MGGTLLYGAVKGTVVADLEAAEVESRMGPVVHGAAVSLANPYWLLWWVTIGAALVAKGLVARAHWESPRSSSDTNWATWRGMER